MEPEKKQMKIRSVISYFVILILAIEVVLLTLQNKDLKHQMSTMSSMGEVEPLKSGEQVEPFIVTMLDGNTRQFTYTEPSRRHLLFVLSTTCPHCENTLPAWRSIAQGKNDNCDVMGISIHGLDETKKFLSTKNVGFYTVSAKDDTSFSRKYKISGVPETILIDGKGIVEKAWVGELSDAQTHEIQNLMNTGSGLTN